MEITLNFKLDGEQLGAVLHAISKLTEGVNKMASATVTGVAALGDLTVALTTFLATDATSISLDEQLIKALQTEVALLTGQAAASADPVKIEALVGQLAAANAARVAANTAVSDAIASVAPASPPPPPPPPPPALSSTVTTLTGPATAVVGGSVLFDGDVTEVAGATAASVPTGTVGLSDSTGVVSGSATLDATGKFSITLEAGLAAGTYAVVADYGGDVANSGSTSSPVTVVVA